MNYLLKHTIEGNMDLLVEVTGRGGRIRRQLLNDLVEKRDY